MSLTGKIVLVSSALAVLQHRCPGCGSGDFYVVGPAAEGFETTINSYCFWQPPYEIRECRVCCLFYKSVIASPDELSRYYASVDHERWEYPKLVPTERRVLALLRELPHGARVLDFGCSSGRLLSTLAGQYQCYGYEINERAAMVAASRGITILTQDQIASPTPELTFDAISAIDVIEHLTHPTELIRTLANLLRPNGRLILSTGDAGASAIHGDPANFWYFRNIEHLCMLNKAYIRYLTTNLKLTCVKWQRESHFASTGIQRLADWCSTYAYEVFHRGRAPWLKPLFRILPRFRNAEHWQTRPPWATTRDHAIIVLERSN